MEMTPDDLAFDLRYKLLTGAVIPRPIALVSTSSEEGCLNVAPFSYFSIASHDPMALSICITGAKPDRSSKDTLLNIQETRQFIVSVVTERFAEAMVKTSAPLPREASEFEACRVDTCSCAQGQGAPRIRVTNLLRMRADAGHSGR